MRRLKRRRLVFLECNQCLSQAQKNMRKFFILYLILLSSCINQAQSETRFQKVVTYKEEAMQDSNDLIEEKILK